MIEYKSLPPPATMSIIFIIFVISVLLLSLQISKKNKKKKHLPPSPPSLPFLGHLHLYLFKEPLHQSLARLSAQYGPLLLLRFGIRQVLVVSDASLAEECFTTNDLAFANRIKLPSHRASSYNYTTLIMASYGPEWRHMRRRANIEALSGPRLSFFSKTRADEARAVARQLYHDSAKHDFTKLELRPHLFGFSFNTMMRMMVGRRYLREVSSQNRVLQLQHVLEEVFSLTGASNIGEFLPSAFGWIARRLMKGKFARIQNLSDNLLQALVEDGRRKIIEEEEEEDEDNNTILNALLLLQKTQPEQHDDCFIKSLFASLLLAGTDTSSNTIEWAMSLLLNNYEKLEKVREEIDGRVMEGCLIEESDLAGLPYLHCVVKETLRLYPVIPLLIPHESLKECKVGGYDIPSETILLVNAYAIQRDAGIWPEPERFLPERFQLDNKVEGGVKMLPFGMGRRRCPGEALAMKQMGLMLGILIQCFEWKRVDSEEVGMKEESGLAMPKQNPLQLLCKPRQSIIDALNQF